MTTQTKTRSTPASTAYLCHVLDAAGVAPKRLRTTRIVDLVVTLDPKVAGEALGMQAEGLVDYLADHVDPDAHRHRLTNLCRFRRHLAHLRPNLCAFENGRLQAAATDACSSRSVMTWNSSSAPRGSS